MTCGPLPARAQADLLAARKARDDVAVAALRSLLAALSNAEAPPAEGRPSASTLGLVEHQPLALDADDHAAVLQAEIRLREEGIREYEAVDQIGAADRLRAELEVLARYAG